MKENRKVALVTGASRGLGKAIALELAAQSITVLLNCEKNEAELGGTSRLISERGGDSLCYVADISDPAQVKNLFDFADCELGGVDILVNNAGITRDRSFTKLSDPDWHQVIQVNLHGAYYCCKAAVPQMIAGGFGRIINVASVVGQTGAFGQANYAAAKSGLIGLSKTLALELAKHGITVNAVCPGYIDTDMVSKLPLEVKQSILSKIPLGKFGKPEDVARTVRFLACEAEYITGANININGGFFTG